MHLDLFPTHRKMQSSELAHIYAVHISNRWCCLLLPLAWALWRGCEAMNKLRLLLRQYLRKWSHRVMPISSSSCLHPHTAHYPTRNMPLVRKRERKWMWSHSVVSDSLRPHGHQSPPSVGFSGKITGVGCHFMLPQVMTTVHQPLYVTKSETKMVVLPEIFKNNCRK